MKIAITGKMGSGKSWVANILVEKYGFYKTSFAKKVKILVSELFNVHNKDRGILIRFASSMRDIDHEIWIRHMFKDIEDQENKNVVIDDLRLRNEYITLKKKGWFFIKIDIDEKDRVQRIKDTYGNDTESHLKYKHSITENDVCLYPDSSFDIVIRDTNSIEKILNDKINSRFNDTN